MALFLGIDTRVGPVLDKCLFVAGIRRLDVP